jgi:hypothetical protein
LEVEKMNRNRYATLAFGLLLFGSSLASTAPTAIATGCVIPKAISGGGGCTFVCEANYLHVSAQSEDIDAQVNVGAECTVADPDNPEDGEGWEATCSQTHMCSGDGATVHEETGRCEVDIDEFYNDAWTGECVNDANPEALVLLVDCLKQRSEPLPCLASEDASAQGLRLIQVCDLSDAAMAMCMQALQASKSGGTGVVLGGRGTAISGALCMTGMCVSVTPTVTVLAEERVGIAF